MHVGGESSIVKKGDIVHIPRNDEHYIVNQGHTVLVYISASTPAYDFTALYDDGDLKEG